MITFDYKNIFNIGKRGLSEDLFQNLKRTSDAKYSFYDLAEQDALAHEIQQYAKKASKFFEYFVVLGIGGSALGARCIADALVPVPNRQKLFVLDNVDPEMLLDFENSVDLTKTLFIVVSKSGSTPETIAQYFYFRKKVARPEQFIFITDPANGFLRRVAEKECIRSFDVPADIGGRFSVLSPVGLLPAALLGVDLLAMLEGAREGLRQEKEAFELAALQYLLQRERDVSMTVLMPYSSRLATFADWYAQLLAESIGKEKNIHGEAVNVGLTPVKAVGATDQHSQIQLYTSGPFDKLVVFLEVHDSKLETKNNLEIPAMYEEESDFHFLHGVSFHKLLMTEKKATERALTEYKRPNATVSIPVLDPATLAGLFTFFEMSVAFLGELYEINAFDQPGVELGKVYTKKMLSS